jgi:hypothetical protein
VRRLPVNAVPFQERRRVSLVDLVDERVAAVDGVLRCALGRSSLCQVL